MQQSLHPPLRMVQLTSIARDPVSQSAHVRYTVQTRIMRIRPNPRPFPPLTLQHKLKCRHLPILHGAPLKSIVRPNQLFDRIIANDGQRTVREGDESSSHRSGQSELLRTHV